MRDPFSKMERVQRNAERSIVESEQERGFESLMNKTVPQAEKLLANASLIALVEPHIEELQASLDNEPLLQDMCLQIAGNIPGDFFPEHIEDDMERAALVAAIAKAKETPIGKN